MTRLAWSGRKIDDPRDLQLVTPYVRSLLRVGYARWARYVPWLFAIVLVGEAIRIGVLASSGRWGWALYRFGSACVFVAVVLWWRRLRTRLHRTAEVNGIDPYSRT